MYIRRIGIVKPANERQDKRIQSIRVLALQKLFRRFFSTETFKKDVDLPAKADAEWLAPKSPNLEAEYNVVVGLLQSCRYGEHQLPDLDGNLIDDFE